MANSADPDQLLQKPTDLDLHCLQGRVYLGSAGQGLILSMLNNSFSRGHFAVFFFFFPEKQDLIFHANCLDWRQFA